MVKKLIFLIIISSYTLSSYAIDGVITVLEAPIFSTPDKTTPVVQYLRKGETLFIHSQEAFKDKYEDIEGLEVTKYKILPDNDELIGAKDIYLPEVENEFYKTITKSGAVGYIFKEHVFLQYKDRRELGQKVIAKDNTDYRISQTLPKEFPFIVEGGYRGQFMFSTGQPNYKAYPFREKIIDSSFDLIKEMNFVWSRTEKTDPERRFFFGAMGGFHFSQINYILETQSAQQKAFRFYLGPFASYDTYKTKNYILNFYTSLQFALYDTMDITIKDSATSLSESRSYQNNFSIFPNIGASFNALKSFFIFDTVVGFNMKFLPPRTFETTESVSNRNLWQDISSSDKLDQSFRTELTYSLGIQSNY
jgi:hypothetical protein